MKRLFINWLIQWLIPEIIKSPNGNYYYYYSESKGISRVIATSSDDLRRIIREAIEVRSYYSKL